MTAVAPPPNFQQISRSGWSAPNGAPNGINSMSADDVTRMFMPRKTAQRTNSSSSLSSQASANSTISASTVQANGVTASGSDSAATWGTRKKPTRGLWPAAKAEPIAGISTARPQSIASASSNASAAAAISALHTPSSMLPSQHNGQAQQNGAPRPQGQSEAVAILQLSPMNGTFERKNITVPFYPDVLRIGRQTNMKTQPTPANGYFDSKVLSRQHAEIYADRNGKIWIRDIKSSNGTFVNGQRLSPENRDSEPHELREQDMLELGIDIVSEDQKTIVHHKVAAKVEHAGIYANGGNSVLDLNFGELDSSNSMNGTFMGQPNGQMRGRTGSQGSMASSGRLSGPASAAGSNTNAMGQPRHMNFWLQPISMEQVVKRLNSEIKQARQQSQDLQRASAYIDSLLSTEPKKDNAKSSPISHGKSMKNDIKARFSDPPAPPPQQPLPEKPDAARNGEGPHQPILKRSETERPKSNSSPVRSDASQQISSLAEALTTARKEIESQSARLKDLEDLLAQERQARESAEERAQRLELESRKDITPPESVKGDTTGQESESQKEADEADETIVLPSADTAKADATTSRLQQRLEIMVAEMDEMKHQMERYRQRAEVAEAESASHRKTLAEMVEKIRKDEAERTALETKKQRRRSVTSAKEGRDVDGTNEENGSLVPPEPADEEIESPAALLRKISAQNGRPVSPEEAQALEQTISQALASRHHHPYDNLLHGGPAASIVGIVLIGVGLMTWLNSWPKVER